MRTTGTYTGEGGVVVTSSKKASAQAKAQGREPFDRRFRCEMTFPPLAARLPVNTLVALRSTDAQCTLLAPYSGPDKSNHHHLEQEASTFTATAVHVC